MMLSQAVEQYILHKRSLGMGFRSEAVRLRAFVKASAIATCTASASRRSLVSSKARPAHHLLVFEVPHAERVLSLRDRARLRFEEPTATQRAAEAGGRFQPYIYTNQDMQRLIDAADSRHRYRLAA